MMTMLGCPSRRRHAGLVLFTHLFLLALLPMAEALHEHGRNWGPELHDAQEECGHEGHRADCSLLLRTVPALPAAGAGFSSVDSAPLVLVASSHSIDLPAGPASPALPRAPPLA